MGKITVKHYLNKKLKPEIKNNEKFYTVYVQITVNRITTQMRSLTFAKMTETEFEKYISKKNYNCLLENFPMSTKDFLEKEPERIKKSFELMTAHYNNINFDKKLVSIFLSYIDTIYLMWTNVSLVNMCWMYQISKKNKQYIYRPFSKERTLIKDFEDLKKYFKVELENKIPLEDFIFWNNVEHLLNHLGNKSIFIDFAYDYKNEIEKTRGIEQKEVFIKQIEEIIDFKNQYFM